MTTSFAKVAFLVVLSIVTQALLGTTHAGTVEDCVTDGFYLVADDGEGVPTGVATIPADRTSVPLQIHRQPIVLVDEVTRAFVVRGERDEACLNVEFSSKGSVSMYAATSTNIGRRMAIVIDSRAATVPHVRGPVRERLEVCDYDWTWDQAAAVAYRFWRKGQQD